MTDQTTNLELPYMLASQSDKHVSFNATIDIVDSTHQLMVVARDVSTPVLNPQVGDRWIVGPTPTGDWQGHINDIACWLATGWKFFTPRPGWRAWVMQETVELVFAAGNWTVSVGQGQVQKLGIRTPADATNILAVSGAAILFTADTTSHIVKINKATSSASGTLAFQSGYSTRAEVGLAGNDKLTIKVSPNGSSFIDALIIDQTTGGIGIGTGAPTCALHVNGPARVGQCSKANLPSATNTGAGAVIYVVDDVNGATLAFSDGVAWRRVTDRGIIA